MVNLIMDYKSLFSYCYDTRKYIVISFVLYVLCAFIGVLIFSYMPGLYNEIMNIFFEFDGNRGIIGADVYTLMVIFINNIVINFLIILFGIVGGILPIIIVIINGTMFGIIILGTVFKIGLLPVLLVLAPYGALEISTLLLSAGLGLRLGYICLKHVLKWDLDSKIVTHVKYSVAVFIQIILPSVILAAVLETFIGTIIANIVL